MKKKLLTIVLSLALTLTVMLSQAATVMAAEYPRLVDGAELLSAPEYEEVLEELNSFSEEHQFDLVIVTVRNGLEDPELTAFADDFYDYNGYGYGEAHDGALLYVDMESRAIHISTTGYGITVLTDYGIDYLIDNIGGYLADGDYEQAFKEGFINNVEWMYEQAVEGEPYDVDNAGGGISPVIKYSVVFGVAILAGLIFAYFMTEAKKKELISIRNAFGAASYLREGSMNLTKQSDRFLYSNLIVNPLPEDDDSGGSSIHTGSSGTSHGGGSGHF